jgi:hypothetical protein
MGYADAKRDNIRMCNDGWRRGYYPRCQFCGKEIFSTSYRSDVRYTCDHCRPLKKILLATGLFDSPKMREKVIE